MTIGILHELAGENRVSVLPEGVHVLTGKGVGVYVETGAGANAFAPDDQYLAAGATLHSRQTVLEQEVLLAIHLPPLSDFPTSSSKVLIGYFQPLYHPRDMVRYAAAGLTLFSLDMIPRTTRAQSMDVLSSQASIAGYKAILLAANLFPRYFPMLMTAAGSIPPAKVLILGAGVAGLQAIATARRLGAVVEVFDTRPAVKEEVVSLGGKFIEVEGAADAAGAGGYAVEQSVEFLQHQQAKIAESIARADIVVTTAQIPGKQAPILVSAKMIDAMKKGSVIIDLASATGGNTALTKNKETYLYKGVTIVGNSALPSTMPYDASRVYGKNVLNFLQLITATDGSLNLDFGDDLVKGCCITHNGAIIHEKIK